MILEVNSYSVIIIDDHKEWCFLLKSELEKDSNFNPIAVAYDGENALHYIQQKLPDIIIIDLLIPIYDGLYILEYIQQQMKSYDPCVYIISAFKTAKINATISRLNCDYFSIKPIKPDVVVFNLKNMLLSAVNEAHVTNDLDIELEVEVEEPAATVDVNGYLSQLGVSTYLLSTKCTRIAIETYSKNIDDYKSMASLYYNVSKIMDMKTPTIEKNIRSTIAKVMRRKTPFFTECFPDNPQKLPNNRFIHDSATFLLNQRNVVIHK